jgi:hypothetical protein
VTSRTERPVLTQHDIETAILETSDKLEELVDDYAEVAELAAVSDVEFKRQQAMMTLAVIQHPPQGADGKPIKMTADERAARIELQVSPVRREAAIAGARREAAREALNTQRTRMEALRTLAANVRYLTVGGQF